MTSSTIDKLTELFNRFPGIGQRQAKRFVYFLLSQNDSFVKELINLVIQVKQETKYCVVCFRLSTKITDNACEICSDHKRDKTKLMIVAKDIDLENVEKSGVYDGCYFILGSLLPILEKNPEEKIRLRELIERIENLSTGNLAEIIIALSANTEGDYTAEYLGNYIASMAKDKQIKVSLLGRGLSTGTELEYSDSDTIRNALKNRQ
ncbi:MAG: recombination protein RecR [Candidatus Vogelbacteria bacterium]|nr:recombination protein RecR [Candidatus Vogelbacteria bacterium]